MNLKVKLIRLNLIAVIVISLFITSCEQKLEVIPNVSENAYPELNERFRSYEIIKLDNYQILEAIRSQNEGEIKLDMRNFTASVFPNWSFRNGRILEVETEDFEVNLIDERGASKLENSKTYVVEADLDNAGELLMMTNETNLHAEIIENGNTYVLEPLLDILPNAQPDEYIKYNIEDVINHNKKVCTNIHSDDNNQEIEITEESLEQRANCRRVQITALGDFDLYKRFNRNSSTTYNWMKWRIIKAGRFYHKNNNYPLKLTIKKIHILTSNGGSWSNTTNGFVVLDKFTNYRRSKSWFKSADANILFKGKNNTDAYGVAVIRGLCKWNRDCYSEYSNSSVFTDHTVAHELGHVFGATHSSGGFMIGNGTAPTWMSQQTRNQLNSFLPGRSCIEFRNCN